LKRLKTVCESVIDEILVLYAHGFEFIDRRNHSIMSITHTLSAFWSSLFY